MNALDRASSKQSRKPSNHLKRQGSPVTQHKSTYQMQNQEDSTNGSGVQLMMNTGKSKKRRHQSNSGVGSIGNSSSREISGTENNRRKKKKITSSLAAASSKSASTKRSCKVSATIEKSKGQISSFFRPPELDVGNTFDPHRHVSDI